MTSGGTELSALDLARRLLAFDTINPPGNEAAPARFLGGLLSAAGYQTRFFDFSPGRSTLLATLEGSGGRSIGFTGHLDTVPLGSAAWTHDPFAGVVDADRLYGRGASDMKAAVAAMVVAALRQAGTGSREGGIVLIITAGEETSCEGARHLAGSLNLGGMVGALVVGEPTSNRPVIAHKGCVRYRMAARGVSAHGSMPDQGVNAIHRIAEVVARLQRFDFRTAPHPLLGAPTLNIGTIAGGSGINLVADAAEIGVDVRLIPGQDEAALRARFQAEVGPDVSIERLEQADSVETDRFDPWIRQVCGIAERYLGSGLEPGGVPYFTDASVLMPALGNPPTVILGPGEAAMAHKTDEYCLVSRLDESVAIYSDIAAAWRGA
ncbi:MAG TPA: M20 family metallopeptidase [Gemmatimonadales bacterium]|nr:M20 family metallopeptidase [Gemmatimonadales bacterium]